MSDPTIPDHIMEMTGEIRDLCDESNDGKGDRTRPIARKLCALVQPQVEALRETEWGTGVFGGRCPSCSMHQTEGHREDCRTAAALALYPASQEPNCKTCADTGEVKGCDCHPSDSECCCDPASCGECTPGEAADE